MLMMVCVSGSLFEMNFQALAYVAVHSFAHLEILTLMSLVFT
jgi:hypothetical protein